MDTAKAKTSLSPTTPPSSARDVLKPLSRDGTLQSSGALAAKAGSEMRSAEKTTGTTGSSVIAKADSQTEGEGRIEGSGSVQKCSESVQQMREVDAEGVRTWKRLIVEYR